MGFIHCSLWALQVLVRIARDFQRKLFVGPLFDIRLPYKRCGQHSWLCKSTKTHRTMSRGLRSQYMSYGTAETKPAAILANLNPQSTDIPKDIKSFLDKNPDLVLQYLQQATNGGNDKKETAFTAQKRNLEDDSDNLTSNVDGKMVENNYEDETILDLYSIAKPMIDYNWSLIKCPDYQFDHPPQSNVEALAFFLNIINTSKNDNPSYLHPRRWIQNPLRDINIGMHWLMVVVINPNQCRRAASGKFYRSMYVSDPSLGKSDMLCNIFSIADDFLNSIYGGTIIYANFKLEKRQGKIMLILDTSNAEYYIVDTSLLYLKDKNSISTPVDIKRRFVLKNASMCEMTMACILKEWYINYRLVKPSSHDSGFFFAIDRIICQNSSDKYQVFAQVLDVIYPSSKTTGSPFYAAIQLCDWTCNPNLGTIGEWARTFYKDSICNVFKSSNGKLSILKDKYSYFKGTNGTESVLTVYLLETFPLELSNKNYHLGKTLVPGCFVQLNGVMFYNNPALLDKNKPNGFDIISSLTSGPQVTNPAETLRETLQDAIKIDIHSPFVGTMFRNQHSYITTFSEEQIMNCVNDGEGSSDIPRHLLKVGIRKKDMLVNDDVPPEIEKQNILAKKVKISEEAPTILRIKNEVINECNISLILASNIVSKKSKKLQFTDLPIVLTWPKAPFTFRSKLRLRRILPEDVLQFIVVDKSSLTKNTENAKHSDMCDFRFAMDLEDPNNGASIRILFSGSEASKFLGCDLSSEKFRFIDFEKRIKELINCDSEGNIVLLDICYSSYRINNNTITIKDKKKSTKTVIDLNKNYTINLNEKICYHIKDTKFIY